MTTPEKTNSAAVGQSDSNALLAASLEEVLGLIIHNDFSHDYESASRECEICKKLRRARKLLAANEEVCRAATEPTEAVRDNRRRHE
jgi:hypothetical protein